VRFDLHSDGPLHHDAESVSSFKAPAPISWSLPKQGRALLHGLAGVLFVSTVGVSKPAFAEDSVGAELAWKYHCTTCHGVKGVANSNRYPNIANQNKPYLVVRLRHFRSQSEPGNQMNAQAAPLSDTEIDALAAYFSGEAS